MASSLHFYLVTLSQIDRYGLRNTNGVMAVDRCFACYSTVAALACESIGCILGSYLEVLLLAFVMRISGSIKLKLGCFVQYCQVLVNLYLSCVIR